MFELIEALFVAMAKVESIKVDTSNFKEFDKQLSEWSAAADQVIAIRKKMLDRVVDADLKLWQIYGPSGPYAQMVTEAIRAR